MGVAVTAEERGESYEKKRPPFLRERGTSNPSPFAEKGGKTRKQIGGGDNEG